MTELERLLREQGETFEGLAKKLGVGRQQMGKWATGRQELPRRRQAQLILHLEAHGIPLFDDEGFALPERTER